MKFDTMLAGLSDAAAHARRLEHLGVDGAFTFEGPHDVFTPLILAAEGTTTLDLATNVADRVPAQSGAARPPGLRPPVAFWRAVHARSGFPDQSAG